MTTVVNNHCACGGLSTDVLHRRKKKEETWWSFINMPMDAYSRTCSAIALVNWSSVEVNPNTTVSFVVVVSCRSGHGLQHTYNFQVTLRTQRHNRSCFRVLVWTVFLHYIIKLYLGQSDEEKEQRQSKKEKKKWSNSVKKATVDVTTSRTKHDRPECGGERINQSSRACWLDILQPSPSSLGFN